MFPAIKLYARDIISGKTKTYEEANKICAEIHEENIKEPQYQKWDFKIYPRPDRKRDKFDFECSFYSLDTIKDMREDGKILDNKKEVRHSSHE